MSLAADGIWKAGVWAQTVWANGVWYEGVVIQQQAASAAPGEWHSHRRKKKKRVEEEVPAVAPPEPDRDAPLRAFIAAQRPAERRVSVSGPEPMPSDAAFRAAQRAAELAQIEIEKKRRAKRLAYLLLLGA